MSTERFGIFVISADQFDALQRLSRTAEEALDELSDNRFLCENKVFLYAQEVTLNSAVFEGEEFSGAYVALQGWLVEKMFGGEDRRIISVEELSEIANKMKGLSTPEVREAMIRRADEYGEIDWDIACQMYEALQRLVTQEAPEGAAVILAEFYEKDEHPKVSANVEEDKGILPEDLDTLNTLANAYFEASNVRRIYDDWANDDFGMVSLNLVKEPYLLSLRDALIQAEDLINSRRVNDALALEHEAHLKVQTVAFEHMKLTKHGEVRALKLTKMYLEMLRPEIKQWHGVYTPTEVIEFAEILDLLERDWGGEEGVIDRIWSEESHWSKEIVRDSYRILKHAVGRTLERGCGFVWLFGYTKGGQVQAYKKI